MAYVAVVKAQFDYAAQDPETELSLSEDQVLYVIEKEDDDWWKAKSKDVDGVEGAVGLVPASYVEEIPPLSTTRALYAYQSTSAEELSMEEDQILQVFSVEEDWLLVRVEGGHNLGFVPKSYCEAVDESRAIEVEDASAAAEALEDAQAAQAETARQREKAEMQRQLRLKDKVETWGIAEMEGKKKKKGTLGVGNGAVFFASDTDKMTPVKQYSITELAQVSQPSSKNLELTFSNLPQPLVFHCGSSDVAAAILAKLESSKAAAGEALEMVEAATHAVSDEEDEAQMAEPKAVRWAEPEPRAAPAANGGGESAKVLYDFDAQGEDELTVKENDVITVMDKENDEWWLVRNSRGQEGVVPAQYVEIGDVSAAAAGGAEYDEEEDERRREEDEAAAAAALEAERQRDQQRKAEQRRAIERAAREKQQQEEHDRRLAELIEQEEAEKAAKHAAKRDEAARRQREREAEQRREAARRMEPPKVSRRPSAQNVAAAAAQLPSRSHAAPARPPENDRPKPNPARTRIWNDKTGQFKVEAEYLGLKDKKIRLHKLNGVIIEVPLEKMSNEDVQLVRRHEARRQRSLSIPDDDDVPLGRSPRRASVQAPPSGRGERSDETRRRAESPIPAAAMEMPKPRKPRFDWFAFFLDAGCDMDDCTRYAANFERDRIDEAILPDLEAGTLRSLGLREGDVIRVKKVVNAKYAKKTPEQEAQIRADEDYARQLQVYENSGSKGPAPTPPPGLFTGPDGKLSNNTRRGRPDKKATGSSSVDPSAIADAADALSQTRISTPPITISPPPEKEKEKAREEPEKPAPLITGFDDDAWTIKPSASKPASPAPPPTSSVTATSTSANGGTDSLLAQIQALRPASTGVPQNNTGGSFDQLSKMVGQPQQQQLQPAQTGSSGFAGPSPYGLGVQNNPSSMSQLQQQQYNPNAPRAPLAPVPSNEGLLNPLQPSMTGMFVPTRGSPAPSPQQQQQMMPQQTGFMQQPMMMQPTGYAQGFQQGYGGQPQQLQPNMTGYPGSFGQPQQQQPSFNAVANMQPQPTGNVDKFAPSNIFAAMKKTDFGKPEEQRPQESVKYDALRPLTTGYNGAPGGGMMPQPTGMAGMGMGMGMMPQQTGMMMGQQPTGYGGMMPQMTGYNPNPQMQGQQTGMGMGYGMGGQGGYQYR